MHTSFEDIRDAIRECILEVRQIGWMIYPCRLLVIIFIIFHKKTCCLVLVHITVIGCTEYCYHIGISSYIAGEGGRIVLVLGMQ